MPAERTLPIAAEHREFTVKVDGQVVPREHALTALSVVCPANHIASARLNYVDGSAGSGDFPLSNLGLFEPGASVEVLAGSGNDQQLVFKGNVVRQKLRVREAASSLLIVDCRHAASRLALLQRSANFFDQTDSDVIQSLLDSAGLTAEVQASTVSHAQLVQYDCSDWDFIVSRASANGLLVCTRGADLAIRAPALGDPVARLQYGATLLEFDAEVDARMQAQAVQVLSWSAAEQALQTQEGDVPDFVTGGNFDPDSLAEGAGSSSLVMHHAALAADEAGALASATWQRMRVELVSGRAKCAGIASIMPGDTVELGGVGQRFSGPLLVTGVRHDHDLQQGWKTHLQFGSVAPDPALRERLEARRISTLLAPAAGLQAGVVTDNEDPAGEFRVRVRLPLVDAGGDGVWARVATLDAGSDRGSFFRPEVGDEVLLGFLDEDPRQPVLLGMLHSSAKAAPLSPSNDNHRKGYKSRSGVELMFDDDKKSLSLVTPAGNRLLLDDDGQGITLQDQHGNRIVLGSDGITIESSQALNLTSGTGATLEAGTSLDLSAAAALKIEGTASTDIKSSGMVKLAGASVSLG